MNWKVKTKDGENKRERITKIKKEIRENGIIKGKSKIIYMKKK